MNSEWHTVPDVAHALSVSPRTIRRWIASGHIHAIRIGRTIRVPADEFETITTNDKDDRMPTRDKEPRSDRDNPLRALLDGALADQRPPKRSEIEDVPLVDEVSEREARKFVERVTEYCAEIVAAARAGMNADARDLIAEAMDELGDMIDSNAKRREDPRGLAKNVRREGAPARRSRVDVEAEQRQGA